MANTYFYYTVLFFMLLFSSCNVDKNKDSATSDVNVVLIVSDDHGMNDLGCYGNSAIQTPNLDALAEEGVRFTNAYCTSASCTASRSVILSGIYNHANGLYGHNHHFHNFQAFESIISLPVWLEELGGYRTARVGKYHVGPEEVFRFQEVLPGDLRNPVEMANNCIDFINADNRKPFFLYFCTGDPHRAAPVSDDPMAPNSFGNRPEGYEGVEETVFSPSDVVVPDYLPDTEECREELAQYYQSVARMDQGFGTLFEHLKSAGKWDNTLVIYVSDNGIAFEGGKTTQYEPGINLPCIVKNPKTQNKGTVSNAFINWADLTPTILDYAGVLEPAREQMEQSYEANKSQWDNVLTEDFHGNTFKEVLLTGSDEEWDETFASHTFHEITMYYPMRTVISGRYKLIWNVAWQLPYPQAQDLWESSTWQSALQREDGMYGAKKIADYYDRPEFELFDLETDPNESENLANDSDYQDVLKKLKEKIVAFQKRTNDPWIDVWERKEAYERYD